MPGTGEHPWSAPRAVGSGSRAKPVPQAPLPLPPQAFHLFPPSSTSAFEQSLLDRRSSPGLAELYLLVLPSPSSPTALALAKHLPQHVLPLAGTRSITGPLESDKTIEIINSNHPLDPAMDSALHLKAALCIRIHELFMHNISVSTRIGSFELSKQILSNVNS